MSFPAPGRRRAERRGGIPVAELTLPELRRIVVTSILFVVVLALFLWMVRTVIIAAILGVVIAVYLRPVYARLAARTGSRVAAALLTLTGLIVPVAAMLVYGYLEVRGVAEYLAAHQAEVVERINRALDRLPFVARADAAEGVRRMVEEVSAYGTRLPEMVGTALRGVSVAAAVFLFTAFYVLTDAEAIVAYLRSKVPPRYVELMAALEANVSGVLYGAIYSTLLTQTIKSGVILAMNLVFGVPLAVLLALLSFVIGFFPIVGSWTVYLPVAGWLLVFRDRPVAAGLMVAVGLVVNTLFLSFYLRPKIAAEKSRVLNFYWMFVGLVTGVYTFGLAGILLGPILIGLLKAVIDTVTAHGNWRLVDDEGEPAGGSVLAP